MVMVHYKVLISELMTLYMIWWVEVLRASLKWKSKTSLV